MAFQKLLSKNTYFLQQHHHFELKKMAKNIYNLKLNG